MTFVYIERIEDLKFTPKCLFNEYSLITHRQFYVIRVIEIKIFHDVFKENAAL